MGIKDATPAEIAGMKKRLADKQAARRCDAECAEAVKMVASCLSCAARDLFSVDSALRYIFLAISLFL